MIAVKATREGLIGQKTATGWTISKHVPYVALPSHAALHQWIVVQNASNGKFIAAIVLDVGPWNEDDDEYVFGTARPLAETGTDTRGRATNHAGIDLGEFVWDYLEMVDNGEVSWGFLTLPETWTELHAKIGTGSAG